MALRDGLARGLVSELRELVEHLGSLDPWNFEVDRAVVEEAVEQHLQATGMTNFSLEWTIDAEAALHRVGRSALLPHSSRWWREHVNAVFRESSIETLHALWSPADMLARSAALDAARSDVSGGMHMTAAWQAASSLALIYIWAPLLQAYEAGLWLLFVVQSEAILVPRPRMKIRDGRLHSDDGPAVSWTGGACYYFLDGIQVDPSVVLDPDSITLQMILDEKNLELRRVLAERFGIKRYLQEVGARVVHEDETGRLWQEDIRLYMKPGSANNAIRRGVPFTFVEVTNATLESDGSQRRFFLRVPPTMRTAREAVAWTFALEPDQYRPIVET